MFVWLGLAFVADFAKGHADIGPLLSVQKNRLFDARREIVVSELGCGDFATFKSYFSQIRSGVKLG